MRWFEGSHPLPSGGGSEENVHRLATRGYVVGGEEDVHRLATRGYGWWWRMKSSTVWRRVATVGGGEEEVHRLATRGYGWWWRMKSSTVWLRVATGGQKSGALLGAIRWFDRSHRHGEKCC
jgi:hypothetical protein